MKDWAKRWEEDMGSGRFIHRWEGTIDDFNREIAPDIGAAAARAQAQVVQESWAEQYEREMAGWPPCACGQPRHPVYGDKCEDCWADTQHSQLGSYTSSSPMQRSSHRLCSGCGMPTINCRCRYEAD